MKGIGTKYLLRVTTLIPVCLVAILFGFFYNAQSGKDLEQHLSRLGEAYIRQLLPAAQFAMLRNDTRTLQGLINASTINPDIKALSFYNASGQLLAYRGGKHALNVSFVPPPYTGDYIEKTPKDGFTMNFLAPVTVPTFNLYKSIPINPVATPFNFHADDILGWLSIDVDKQPLLIKRYQMLVVSIFITLLGLLAGLTVHHFLSRRIYLPIGRLRRSMKQILRNEFETQIKINSKGELGIIEKGCEHLQKQYLSTLREMNQHIEIATEDLQQSLELLEEKNIELSLEKKKTEEKSRQKSEFIANMSHEIRTPMNGVIGFVNVLLETRLDSLQLDYVKTIKSSAQDLLAVINDILDYSRIDAGKLHLDSIPMDIRHCIDDVLILAAPNAHKKGLDLIPITEANVPATVLGDPFRIKQIITNLVNNAVKFTDHGHVLIRTRVDQEMEDRYILSLSVIDTGRGLSNEEQTKLFTAFHQADTTITRRYGGSGLGLVICKKLAEQMQGRIILNSELHKGSTFTVTVTVEKLPAYEVKKGQENRFAHFTALCFDDNPYHLESLMNGVRFFGIPCIAISNMDSLREAFEKYKGNVIALINMHSGQEQQISELLKSHAEIPAILLSKWPLTDYEKTGARASLFKPISIQKMHDILESISNETCLPMLLNHEPDYSKAQFKSFNPRVLIAEDNPVNRFLLHSMLKDYCASIREVEDGLAAVSLCNSEIFDLILLDLQMPDMNGLDASRKIHESSLMNRNTPIAIISASSNPLKKTDMHMAGIALWLQKPIDEKDMINQLLQLLQKKSHKALDWNMCLQRASGKETLAIEILDKFIEELRKNHIEFPLFFENDIKKLGDAAHKLYGACCYCGVPELQKKVAQVEKLASQQKKIPELQQAFAELMQEIEAVLNEYIHFRKMNTNPEMEII